MQNKKVLIEKLQLLFITIVAITMPFSIRANSVSIVLLVSIWLMGGLFKVNGISGEKNITHFLITISLFVLYVIGLIYTKDFHLGLKELETKLPLFVFPIIFYTIPSFDLNKLRVVLLSFVGANITACFYCLISLLVEKEILINGFEYIQPWDFINENFTDPIGIHPLYLSCYLDFSLAIIFWDLTNNKPLKSRLAQIIFGLLSVSIIIFNLFAMSRMGLFIMIILFGLFIYQLMIKKKMIWIAISIFMVVIISFILMVSINSTFRERALTLFSEKAVEGSLNQRKELWYSSLTLFQKNYLLGVGTGDTKDELINEYKINNYNGEYYNCHDEYLQTGNAIGIFGLVALILALIFPLWNSRNNLVHLFMIILIMGFLTESMLSTQKGAVFYAFFYSLFAFQDQKLEKSNYIS